jgi:UDP-N-acetylmuramoyl-tripeptide--D-alanyl-D-alanine ligase
MATPIPRNRARFTLAEIADVTGGSVVGKPTQVGAVGVSTDSRAVEAGTLYVALRGERHDGHCFLAQAAAAGAAASLVQDRAALPRDAAGIVVADTQRALGDLAAKHVRRWGGRVVAITGSVGKTTTKELAFAGLHAAGARVARSEGNLNNLVGAPMSVLALDGQHDLAVLELGTSAPGEIARLAEITAPRVAVVTGVAAAHTAGLGTLEQVAAEKAALLWALPEDGVAIYRVDDVALAGQLGRVRAKRRLGFGHSQLAAVRLLDHALSAAPSMVCAVRIEELSRTLRFELSLFGAGPAVDAAAAMAVVYAVLGEGALERAAAGLEQVAPPPGRLVPLVGRHGALILDDSYNANPASMRASIDTALELARLRGGRALLVLGDMLELGERSRAEHELVGKLAAQTPVSHMLACGPEMTAAAEAAREQARRKQHELSVSHLSDPSGAGDLLAPLLGPGDVVLVKGSRSMRMERALAPLLGEGAEDAPRGEPA